ncbi:MAG: tautomerase family protein [Methanobacteriaceae archaeon]|jgi:4-oxalocrotonate tautomerase|uniref:4-oxalocrotonate tautomerase DmpI n=1 Tax=Methanobrevibacter sp. UBA46 TaxID=1915488 RepID=UPI0037602AB0|nr:tautomerase family protein [Methanobacteriaceae archaeon]
MPVITIAGNEGISVDKKRKMVKDISETVAEAYDLPVSAITVLVQAYPSESVGVGGSLLSDLLKE